MKPIKFLAVLALILLVSAESNAQVRSRVQHRRIEQGTRSGELTRHERRQLSREQRNIRREKREVRRDGRVTPRERREIRRHERRANRHIIRKRHNRREAI